MKLYLASRFSRIKELRDYKRELEELGFGVTSRWLLGGHEWVGTSDDDIPVDVLARFAMDDIEDLEAADLLVCFTEPPRSGPARGGRHVEFGYALAKHKPIIVVGHRENVFYCLPDVHFAADWPTARAAILDIETMVEEEGQRMTEERRSYRGWYMLTNSKKWHYFDDSATSLCRRFWVPGLAVEDLEDTNHESSDNCAACNKKRIAAESKRT